MTSEVPLAELGEAIERAAPDMNSQGAAMTTWAYGTLGVPPTRRVVEELEAALRRVVTMSEVPLAESLRRAVTDMIPRRLSDIIWACSGFGLRPMPSTLDALGQASGGLIRKMSPQMVSNVLYGYAALPRTATYDTRDAGCWRCRWRRVQEDGSILQRAPEEQAVFEECLPNMGILYARSRLMTQTVR